MPFNAPDPKMLKMLPFTSMPFMSADQVVPSLKPKSPTRVRLPLLMGICWLLFSVPLLAQVPQVQWQRSFGGGFNDGNAITRQTPDGGYLVAGSSFSLLSGSRTAPNYGGWDYWVIKLDSKGEELWQQSFGGSGDELCTTMELTPDGGCILGGHSNSGISGNKTTPSFGNWDCWVVKLDADGNKEWENTLGGDNDDELWDLHPTMDGGYLLTPFSASGVSGNKLSPNFGGADVWVIKLDATGKKVWEKTFGGLDWDPIGKVAMASDGGCLLAVPSWSGVSGNKTVPGHGALDLWLIRLDANGNALWQKSYGGSGDDGWMGGIEQTADGGFILASHSNSPISGNKTSPSFGGWDYWILKLDANGNKIWERSFGGAGDDRAGEVRQMPDGGYLLIGYSKSSISGTKTTPNFGDNDGLLIRLDASGNELWERTLGGFGDDQIDSLALTSDGGFVLGALSASAISGVKTSPNYGGFDYWVIKMADHLDCDPVPPGLSALWRADGDAKDALGTLNGEMQGSVEFEPGNVGEAFRFDGFEGGVLVPPGEASNPGAGDGLTIAAWILPRGQLSGDLGGSGPIVEWEGSRGAFGLHFWQHFHQSDPRNVDHLKALFLNLVDTDGNYHIIQAENVITQNTWNFVALTYSRITGEAALFVNGAQVASQNLGTFVPDTTGALQIGHRSLGAAYTFNGDIDELALFKRNLSASEIQAIYQAGSSGMCEIGESAIAWMNPAGGDWSLPSNWRPSRVPGPQDHVVINQPGNYIITNKSDLALSDLVIGATSGHQELVLASGTLTLNGTATVAETGHITLRGGTVNGGVINLQTPGAISVSGPASLVGLKINGSNQPGAPDLDLLQGAQLTIREGLVLNGGISLQGTASAIIVDGTQTFSTETSGSIAFEGDQQELRFAPQGGVLSIGPGVLIRGRLDIREAPNGVASAIRNQGTISADSNGRSLRIFSASNGTWTNESTGLMQAMNGGILEVNGESWHNEGSFYLTTNSIINLGGAFSTLDLGAIARAGGVLKLSGTILNTGSELDLDESIGSMLLSGGVIHGGIIRLSQGSQLIIESSGNRLEGVTVTGANQFPNSDIELSDAASLLIRDNLILNGSLALHGAGAALIADGTQAFGTETDAQIIFSPTPGASQEIRFGAEGGTLTIGPGVVVRGGRGIFREAPLLQGKLVNLGRITADLSGEKIEILSGLAGSNGSFENEGLLEAVNGGTLQLNGRTGINGNGGLQAQSPGLFWLTGDLFGNATNPAAYSARGPLVFADNAGQPAVVHRLEVMGADLGAVPEGFMTNFNYGLLKISAGIRVRLVDLSDNSPGAAPEALYVDSLLVETGADLDLGGLNLYVKDKQVAAGATVTGNITLAAPPLLAISADPSTTPIAGSKVTFTATATGTPPLRYQWRFNGENIPGATAPAYTINQVQVADSGKYSCSVVNDFGAVITDAIDLQVPLAELVLTDNFADRLFYAASSEQGASSNEGATVEAGEPSHAGKKGGHSMWLAWRAPRNGIVTFDTKGSSFDTLLAVYTGDTISSLVPLVSDEDAGGYFTSALQFKARKDTEYQIAIDGLAGAKGRIVLAWSLEDTEEEFPRIDEQPQSHTAKIGETVSLHVGVENPNGVTYQWTRNDVPIPGAATDTLTLTPVTVQAVGTYRVIITAGARSLTSEPAQIELSDAPDPGRSQDKFEDFIVAQKGAALRARALGGGFPLVTAGVAGSQNLNNFGATTELGEPVYAGVQIGASRWYQLTAADPGVFIIDTLGSDIDTVLGVYLGDDLLTLVQVAEDDNGAPDHIRSRVQFAATQGAPYVICVAGVNGSEGQIKLNWRLGQPPVVTSPPASQSVRVGAALSLAVTATARPAAAYQWFLGGAPIAGANGPTLQLPSIQPGQFGKYQVQISNEFGSASAEAILTQLPTFDFDPSVPPRLANGLFQLQISGIPRGKIVVIESSNNLRTWSPVFTNKLVSPLIFSDPVTDASRFYRAVEK